MHGLLRVSHADHRIEQGTVRFTFLGLKRPPQLTPRIMAFIWDKAHDAGYVVHSLDQYASVMDSVAAKSVQEVLSASRKRAEGTVAGVRDESIMQLREFAKEGATRYA